MHVPEKSFLNTWVVVVPIGVLALLVSVYPRLILPPANVHPAPVNSNNWDDKPLELGLMVPDAAESQSLLE
jgi:hypothetical protein